MTDNMARMVERLRLKLYDVDASLNLLDGRLEFEDARLEGFIRESLDKTNDEAPQTNYGIGNFPNRSVLVQGAFVHALKARAILHLRNQVNYNDAGLSVGIEDKHALYLQVAQMEEQEYQRMLRVYKSTEVPSMIGIDSPFGWY